MYIYLFLGIVRLVCMHASGPGRSGSALWNTVECILLFRCNNTSAYIAELMHLVSMSLMLSQLHNRVKGPAYLLLALMSSRNT